MKPNEKIKYTKLKSLYGVKFQKSEEEENAFEPDPPEMHTTTFKVIRSVIGKLETKLQRYCW